jgi:nucleotide-binding universal stress UspA family protein
MSAPGRSGPIVIGYDGSPAADRAITEGAALMQPRRALVVSVWEPGTAFAVAADPIAPLTPVDVRVALDVDKALVEAAQRMAQRGADEARAAGLDPEPLAVADDIGVAETLVSLAKERDAPAIVVGTHGHRALSEVLFGSTARAVIKRSPVPVTVVQGPER